MQVYFECNIYATVVLHHMTVLLYLEGGRVLGGEAGVVPFGLGRLRADAEHLAVHARSLTQHQYSCQIESTEQNVDVRMVEKEGTPWAKMAPMRERD